MVLRILITGKTFREVPVYPMGSSGDGTRLGCDWLVQIEISEMAGERKLAQWDLGGFPEKGGEGPNLDPDVM